MLVLTILSVLLAVLVGWGLYYKSLPLLEKNTLWDLLSSSAWKPSKGQFGFFAFIMGTLWVTAIAVLLALPLCLLSSIFISEYAHPRLRKIIVPVVDLLSGIPPVVFGVWGVLMVVLDLVHLGVLAVVFDGHCPQCDHAPVQSIHTARG